MIESADINDPNDRSFVVLSYLSTDNWFSDDDELIEFTHTQDQVNIQRQGIGANTAGIIGTTILIQ